MNATESLTDTTDTVLRGTPANKGNYANCSRRSDSHRVTRWGRLFTDWIYDHQLKLHAAAVKTAHPLMLRAIAAAKKKTIRPTPAGAPTAYA